MVTHRDKYGPLLFLLYINYLPKIANDNAEVIL
jgi:hypothetical protein